MIRQILGFNNPESTILPPKINEQKPTIWQIVIFIYNNFRKKTGELIWKTQS
jgi:hypothetical protein